MTAIFIPDYFIGRARTAEGILGDVVNMAWDGPDDNIHRVMQAAGWHLSQPITFASSMKIVVSVLAHKPYPEAPVSPLFLFGRQQDFAYQKDVDGSAPLSPCRSRTRSPGTSMPSAITRSSPLRRPIRN